MQSNPVEEWQRLTAHYREMGDQELEELAAGFGDLTETAQQVLRGEMKQRGLGDPLAERTAPRNFTRPAPSSRHAEPGATEDSEDDLPSEFTWKTPLCECDDTDKAWQLREALKRAGIDSWIEQPGSSYIPDSGLPHLLVAADQLEEAAEIARQPIPQEIIDQFAALQPEYEPPVCPECGAEDPVLESADPVNSWLCEACGNEWSDPDVSLDTEAEKSN